MILTLTIPDDLDGADHAALLAELDDHLRVVMPLRARVAVLATAAEKVDRIAVEVDDALGRVDGRPWIRPVGAPFGYRKNAAVTHLGHLWRSTRAGNVWEPGTTDGGWVDEGPADGETPAPEADEWAPDTDYLVGDVRSYGGLTYSCIQAHHSLTGWEPPNVPALWAAI